MSVIDVVEKISDDEDLAEEFCNLESLEDVKEFIKKFDGNIKDEEIEHFIDDTVSNFSELSPRELQDVAGGVFNKKFLPFPMVLMAAFFGIGSNYVAMSTIASHRSAAAKHEKAEKTALGKEVLEKFKSDQEIKKSVDKYKLDGFLTEPNKTDMPNSMASRQSVFFDTLDYCMKHSEELEVKIDGDDYTSNKSEIVHYDHKKFLNDTKNDEVKRENPAQVYLTNGKSLQSLNAVSAVLNKKIENVSLLNFANYYEPGGGVIQGCTAQEESLCRMTDLYPHLATKEMKENFYQKHTIFPENMQEWGKSGIFNEAIYTKDIKQIKDDYGIGRVGEYVDGPNFNVITAAAPDFRDYSLAPSEIEEYKECMRNSWRMIFATAYMHGDTNLVLGALGCGAFLNDPALVSEAFYDVLTEKGPGGKQWMYCFDNIILPIYTSNKHDKNNYDKFKAAYDKKYYPLSGKKQIEMELPSIL
ncbi:MAG: TIGR02452 family protein [Clostridia bacterium]|nr:TIGR02452 family protein [Clostridia bacterium]